MGESKSYYKDVLLNSSKQNVIDNAIIQKFPAEYHFGPHMHSTVEVLVCLEGQCNLKICQTEVPMKKEEYIVIFQKHPHSFEVQKNGKCVVLQLHFHPNIFMDLFSDSLEDNQFFFLIDLTLERKNYIQGKCSEQLYNTIRYIYEESKNKKANWKKMIDLYFTQLLVLLSRDIGRARKGDVKSNRHLLSAFEYIKEHYMEKITADQLSEYCGITSRYLGELFKSHLGMNISSYIIYFRINKSIELMMEEDKDYTLTEIALEAGFSNLQYYSKVFKSVMNISPAKYYSNILKNPPHKKK